MKRKFFSIASVLSLLLCTVSSALWSVSYRHEFMVWIKEESLTPSSYHHANLYLESGRGTLGLQLLVLYDDGTKLRRKGYRPAHRWDAGVDDSLATDGMADHWGVSQIHGSGWSWQHAGFVLKSDNRPSAWKQWTDKNHEFIAIAPDWFIAFAFCILPFAWIMSSRGKSVAGHCRCGYNLACNTSGVCPEMFSLL